MKVFKIVLFALLIAVLVPKAHAQMIGDPATWTYEVKKKGAGKYDIICHLTLRKDWHIWALKPGGDGMQIPPTFTFVPNATVKLVGKMKEVGKRQVLTMEGVDGKVALYEGKVDYVQEVAATGKTKITGKHSYQVCSNTICLPAKTKDLSFNIE